MDIKVIKIGNSHGIRLSKTILKQLNSPQMLKATLQNNKLTLEPVQNMHQIWEDELKNYKQTVPLLIPDNLDEDLNLDPWN